MEGTHQILRSPTYPATFNAATSVVPWLGIGFSALAQCGTRRGSPSAALEYKEVGLVPSSGDKSVLFDAGLPVKLP